MKANKTQNILILGHGLTQKVNNTTIFAIFLYQLVLIFQVVTSKIVNCMEIFMALVLTIVLSNDKIHDIDAYLMKKNGII